MEVFTEYIDSPDERELEVVRVSEYGVGVEIVLRGVDDGGVRIPQARIRTPTPGVVIDLPVEGQVVRFSGGTYDFQLGVGYARLAAQDGRMLWEGGTPAPFTTWPGLIERSEAPEGAWCNDENLTGNTKPECCCVVRRNVGLTVLDDGAQRPLDVGEETPVLVDDEEYVAVAQGAVVRDGPCSADVRGFVASAYVAHIVD